MTAQFNAIGLVVEDMAKALAFYRAIGLEIDAEADSAPHAEVTLPGGLRLLFDTPEVIKSFDPSWKPPTGGHGMGLAFACDSPSDVDAIYAELTGKGYHGHLQPWDAFWGQRYATVHDPDGHAVDLYAPLPANE